MRVRGREGAFSNDLPFELSVEVLPGECSALFDDLDATPLPPTSLAAQAGGFETVILADWSRMNARYNAGEVAALQAKLAQLAARPDVKGVVVDVSQDARVAAANGLADPGKYVECPYAKNLVAQSIKAIADRYSAQNPIKYIVLVGNDDVVPFFRYADNALLGPESNYVPPVLDPTASQASLRLNYILGQDAYGAAVQHQPGGGPRPRCPSWRSDAWSSRRPTSSPWSTPTSARRTASVHTEVEPGHRLRLPGPTRPRGASLSWKPGSGLTATRYLADRNCAARPALLDRPAAPRRDPRPARRPGLPRRSLQRRQRPRRRLHDPALATECWRRRAT